MRRRAAVLFGLLVLAGCDRDPPKIETVRRPESPGTITTFVLPTEPAPASTDPATKALVEAALKAHTGGQLAKLDALKTASKVVTGTLTGPNGRLTNEWQFTWRWPDRLRTRMSIEGQPPATVRRVGGSAWMAAGGQPEVPITEPNLKGVLAENFAECLLVLFPLADPAAVLTPAADLTVRDRRAIGVRVSGRPDWPTAVAHFDADTKRLVQVSYEGYEGGATNKEVVVLSEKAFDGVTVPERLAIRWAGREVGEWTLKELQFPAKLEPDTFDKP